MARIWQRAHRVDRLRAVDQGQWWVGRVLQDIELRLRRREGHGAVPLLRSDLQAGLRGKATDAGHQAVYRDDGGRLSISTNNDNRFVRGWIGL